LHKAQETTKEPRKPPCRFCGRHRAVPCMNTRDMDRDDGLNNDPVCNATLLAMGGGERGRRTEDNAETR
jgi:hypothetical protein